MATPAPVTVKLEDPIVAFGQRVDALVISRKMNGGDLLATEGLGKVATTLKLIERLYRTPDGKEIGPDAVLTLSNQDIAALAEAMGPFAGIGLETGARPGSGSR